MTEEGPLLRPSEAPPSRATVFVSDPSAEAERAAQLLRGSGYMVVDVPMAMLVDRVFVQKPDVIIMDADVAGAADALAAVREIEGGAAIDVLLLGEERTGGGPREASLAGETRMFFARPVDPTLILKKIDALTLGATSQPPAPSVKRPSSRAPGRMSSRPPPPVTESAVSGASSSAPPSGAPSSRGPSSPGLRWMPDRRSPLPPLVPPPLSARPPPSTGPGRDGVISVRPAVSIQASLSAELEALLIEAEQRVGTQMMNEASLPTPEEELEAVLPAELLAALDEPLEEEEDESAADGGLSRLGPASPRVTTGGGGGGAPAQTSSGRALTPAAVEASGPYTVAGTAFALRNAGWAAEDEVARAIDVRARTVAEIVEPPPGPGSIGVAPTLSATALGAMSAGLAEDVTPPAPAASSRRDADGPAILLTQGDPPRLLASAVAARASGSISFETAGALRRIVLRDGDVVTAASSADDETLLAFMTSRGDLRREQVVDLMGKVAPFGRLAGAAIVAHGLLRQDQLWTALRAHAEWILGRTLNVERGTARIEAEAPGRLQKEPSVFGGSSGAEVLIEAAKRAITPEEALRRLGGTGSRVTEGAAVDLLLECALDPEERALLDDTRGLTLGEIIARARGRDFAPTIYMLSLLGVSAVVPALHGSSHPPQEAHRDAVAREDDVLALDLTAVRERVRARYDLVCEADYFTLLGVSRDATGYEVRRAFLELRRAFEPSRILSPEIVDLEADVKTIVVVLEEAYEILRDSARRERYRRALGDAP